MKVKFSSDQYCKFYTTSSSTWALTLIYKLSKFRKFSLRAPLNSTNTIIIHELIVQFYFLELRFLFDGFHNLPTRFKSEVFISKM